MIDHFKEKAQEWDARPISVQLRDTIGPAMLERLTLDAQMHVMDFGAGTGLITEVIAPHVKTVHAVDISPAMLETLNAKLKLQGKVTTYCQNILEKPLDRSFDLIVSAMAMHHVKDTAGLVAQFHAHLKAGGQVALADLDTEDGTFHPPHAEGIFHYGFDRKGFEALLQANGFRDSEFTTVHVITKEEKAYPIFLVIATKDS